MPRNPTNSDTCLHIPANSSRNTANWRYNESLNQSFWDWTLAGNRVNRKCFQEELGCDKGGVKCMTNRLMPEPLQWRWFLHSSHEQTFWCL